MARIRQDWVVDAAFPVGRNFFRKFSALFRTVDTDRIDVNLLVRFNEITQVGQLPSAVWSPVAPVEHEHGRLAAARGGKCDLLVIVAVQRKVRSEFPNL